MRNERQRVVDEAMTWLRTPYHHQARIKGVGVDCAQFPIAVYSSCGLIPDYRPEYSDQWHLHRSEELYLREVEKFAVEIEHDQLDLGDFVVWKWGRTFSHGGILLGHDQVIHSYVGIGVTLDNINDHCELKSRPRKFFTIWGDHGRR